RRVPDPQRPQSSWQHPRLSFPVPIAAVSAIGLPGEIFPQVHDGNQEPGLGAQAQNIVFSPLFLWFGSNARDREAIDFRAPPGNSGHRPGFSVVAEIASGSRNLREHVDQTWNFSRAWTGGMARGLKDVRAPDHIRFGGFYGAGQGR